MHSTVYDPSGKRLDPAGDDRLRATFNDCTKVPGARPASSLRPQSVPAAGPWQPAWQQPVWHMLGWMGSQRAAPGVLPAASASRAAPPAPARPLRRC